MGFQLLLSLPHLPVLPLESGFHPADITFSVVPAGLLGSLFSVTSLEFKKCVPLYVVSSLCKKRTVKSVSPTPAPSPCFPSVPSVSSIYILDIYSVFVCGKCVVLPLSVLA